MTTFACWVVDLKDIRFLNDKYISFSPPTSASVVHINSEYFRDNRMNVRVVYSLDWNTVTSLTMESKMVGIARRHLKRSEKFDVSVSKNTTRNEEVYLLQKEEELLNLLPLLLP